MNQIAVASEKEKKKVTKNFWLYLLLICCMNKNVNFGKREAREHNNVNTNWIMRKLIPSPATLIHSLLSCFCTPPQPTLFCLLVLQLTFTLFYFTHIFTHILWITTNFSFLYLYIFLYIFKQYFVFYWI